MPVKKPLPYRTIVRTLLASKKLPAAEHKAFQQISDDLAKGAELERSQRLWIETMKAKYLPTPVRRP